MTLFFLFINSFSKNSALIKWRKVKIDSVAPTGSQGKYVKYVSFYWPPVETVLSFSNVFHWRKKYIQFNHQWNTESKTRTEPAYKIRTRYNSNEQIYGLCPIRDVYDFQDTKGRYQITCRRAHILHASDIPQQCVVCSNVLTS